ncbi:hypothetical protein CHS0354_043046 [Potamilus streckersoni]|uniref:Uncharacterized protein n=1 Tax=Potamilus streckersoni TaxID=2493646 RepID=A0AAE0SCZ5_9BIVA|nr:hypothetical protein CHS0354_043046 [Potamilus streckersoni]
MAAVLTLAKAIQTSIHPELIKSQMSSQGHLSSRDHVSTICLECGCSCSNGSCEKSGRDQQNSRWNFGLLKCEPVKTVLKGVVRSYCIAVSSHLPFPMFVQGKGRIAPYAAGSSYGTGGELFQQHGEKLKPIAVYSITITYAEVQYARSLNACGPVRSFDDMLLDLACSDCIQPQAFSANDHEA